MQPDRGKPSVFCMLYEAHVHGSYWLGFWNKVTDIIQTVTGQKVRDGSSWSALDLDRGQSMRIVRLRVCSCNNVNVFNALKSSWRHHNLYHSDRQVGLYHKLMGLYSMIILEQARRPRMIEPLSGQAVFISNRCVFFLLSCFPEN